MTRYAAPGQPGAQMNYQPRYDHWIGGKYVAPAQGRYFDNPTPVTGETFCEVARGTAEDVERALDAAHGAAPAWGRTSAADRANVLNRIADRMEANLPALAVAETWENGKPIRETLAADIPLAIDHFRYFAGAIRAQEGSLAEIDDDTVAYHFHEPLGVVAQIIPWNFPILMAVWKVAPALAAGNTIVVKPAELTTASSSLPVVQGSAICPGRCRERDPRVRGASGTGARLQRPGVDKVAFTGEHDRQADHGVASENLKPLSLELGGKARTSSSRTSRRPPTTSTTRRWRASRCSPSTRARCVHARRARSSSRGTTRNSWTRQWPAPSRSCRGIRSTPER